MSAVFDEKRKDESADFLQHFATLCRFSAGVTEKLQVVAEYLQSLPDNPQVLQKICRYCIKHMYAGITENVHDICRYCIKSAGIAENLQVLQKIYNSLQKICKSSQKICWRCRKSAGHGKNSAGITAAKMWRVLQSAAENVRVLWKIFRYCKKSAGITGNLQRIAENLQVLQKMWRV